MTEYEWHHSAEVLPTLPLGADITAHNWLLHLVNNLLPITHSSVTFQTCSNKSKVRQSGLLFTHKLLHYHSFLYITRLCVAWLVWVGCIPTQEVLRISESKFLLSLSPNLSSNLLKTLECRCSWPSKPTGNAPFQSSVTFLVPIYFL
jgi:hypothetical protein